MKKLHLMLMGALCFSQLAVAQITERFANEDERQRGYYDRPWQRYEAEEDVCNTNGTILPASFENAKLQSEATNQVATNLVNKGDYIEWTCGKEANAMTIRFSLPDKSDGLGTEGNLGVYINDTKVSVYQDGEDKDNVFLTSYWAWQYFDGQNVAFDTPRSSAVLRMRFDEVVVLLPQNIAKNAKFKIVKEDDNTNPYTIDFVELEKTTPVTFESLTNAIRYEGDGSDLNSFINNNVGKTIYLGKGKYNVPTRINMPANTTLQGAGIFYTQVYFSAPLTDSEYNKRGFWCSNANQNVKVKGMYVNTVLNCRYYQRNAGQQPGKGFNDGWGIGSEISDILVQHFECGAWIENAKSLTFRHVRIRNNYADGTNIASASTNCVVEHCNYRNNGDDDMASWSRTGLAQNLTFQYCTSELNWRAAAIGLFGGKNHTVDHCLVIDPIEMGLRLSSEFGGTAFSDTGMNNLTNISIYNAGTYGTGKDGTIWKSGPEPAICINVNGGKYAVRNIHLKDIDIYNPKQTAIQVRSDKNFILSNVCLEDINIYKFKLNGLQCYGTYRTGSELNYYNIKFYDTPAGKEEKELLFDKAQNLLACNKPYGESCKESGIFGVKEEDGLRINTNNGMVEIVGATAKCDIRIINPIGQCVENINADSEGMASIYGLSKGTYIIIAGNEHMKFVIE